MEQPVLHRPQLNLRENFLSETLPGAMRHFGCPELLHKIIEAPCQHWLNSATLSQETCITPSGFSTPPILPSREGP